MAKPIAKLFDESVRLSEWQCNVRDFNRVSLEVNDHKPDVVINLAGVSHVQFVADSDITLWGAEIATNLLGSYIVSKAAIQHNPDCIIILIGSVAGKYGKPQHSGYCASKAGVISLGQSLGKEGYCAYCISPGRVDTKMRESDYPHEDKRTRLKTEDIARVVREIIEGKHQPGDNIVIRKRGYRTLRRIDCGAPWHRYLNVRPLRPGETPIKDI